MKIASKNNLEELKLNWNDGGKRMEGSFFFFLHVPAFIWACGWNLHAGF
jgi:hypothetical protein